MKNLILVLLLFSPAAFAAVENSSSADELTIGKVDLSAPVSYADEFNEKGYPFDPYFKAELDSKQSVIDAVCTDIKNFVKKMDCISEVFYRFVRAGRLRGTPDFVRLNYIPLNNQELRQRVLVLQAAKKKAKNFLVGDRPNGVLDRAALELEINEIRQLIGRRNRSDLIKECEQIFGEDHARCKLP